MQRQMTRDNDMSGSNNSHTHRLEMENMKLKFMLEMDKAIKERLGESLDRRST